ncbi:hypothetical protein DNU06_00810 [Putridiphycobacter roseus]|uniref:Lipocalin-like domain-containing protein n=1 Tax=Putridiphycobacter roseus TaxID=2219161 RepID=A0A2W1NUH3_9FLAO|nr:hypothetical protein [Putridiphycobacter roseus]PZE18408.1 hypothetical protein DNU06_00810 [Putridiphycobacter roseus]
MTRKAILLSALFLTVLGSNLNAQTMKEKLEAKKAALEAKLNEKLGALSNIDTLDPDISQEAIMTTWADGKHNEYYFNGSSCQQTPSEIDLKFTREDGKVVAVTYDGAEYRADHEGISDFVRYYKSPGNLCIVFAESWAYVFTYTHNETSVKGKYFINRKLDYAYSQTISRYLEASKVHQADALAEIAKKEAADADKAAAEKKAKWSIEGKNLAKVEITDVKAPHKFGYFRGFSFQVKATLKNGKTISTKDGGFWSDYTMTYTNGDYDGATIKPTTLVKDDKIIVTVSSKFDPSIKATQEVVLNYDEALYYTMQAKNWGTSANDYKIEIKQVKHQSNGTDLLLYRVTDLDGYDPVQVFKLRADQTLHFKTDGANGYKTVGVGNETGPGANAGNGGNITVIKDPSVTSYNLNYSLKGGTGGAGTYGYNRGQNGRDGIFKEEVRTVNF